MICTFSERHNSVLYKKSVLFIYTDKQAIELYTVFDYIKNFVLSTKFAFLCLRNLACDIKIERYC